MNGDVTDWIRGTTAGGLIPDDAQNIYGDNGDYLGSMHGGKWIPAPGGALPMPGGTQNKAPEQTQSSDNPWCWLLGSDCKFDIIGPVAGGAAGGAAAGSVIPGVGTAGGAIIGTIGAMIVDMTGGAVEKATADLFVLIVVVALGGILVWTGSQALLKGSN